VPEKRDVVVPQIVLAPLVGFDGACYRLGYGGGYFDRTLAALSPRPFAIGVGFEAQRLATIYPQSFDMPMDVIVTEAGIRERRPGDAGSPSSGGAAPAAAPARR
jgi:5,10-methenyltetrahydrofolate synthetase